MIFNIEALNGSFLHELIHSTGQSHGEHPDLAYACHAACMDVKRDSISRFFGQDESPESVALKQSAQAVCQNRLGEEETETYIQHMRTITDNVGSITLFNGFLNQRISSGREFATDPLMLFEHLWRDSNYYVEKNVKREKRNGFPLRVIGSFVVTHHKQMMTVKIQMESFAPNFLRKLFLINHFLA